VRSEDFEEQIPSTDIIVGIYQAQNKIVANAWDKS